MVSNCPKIDLEISNFQAHKSLEVNAQGFVVIVGKTNSGKSALVRALSTVTLNRWHKSWTTQGTKETTIKLKLEHEGKSLDITVKKPKNTLEVNGKVYQKIGSKQPEVLEKLKFDAMINFDNQLTPLFFISETPAKQSALLKKLFETEKQEVLLNEVNKRIKERTILINSNDEMLIKRLKPNLMKAKTLSEMEIGINYKMKQARQLEQLINEAQKLSSLNSQVLILDVIVTKNEEKYDLARQLEQMSRLKQLQAQLSDLMEQIKILDKLVSFVSSRQKQSEQLDNYTRLKQKQDSVIILSQQIQSLEFLVQKINAKNKWARYLDSIDGFRAKQTQLSKYPQQIQSLEFLIQKMNVKDKWIKYLEDVTRLKQKQDSVIILSQQIQSLEFLVQKIDVKDKWIEYQAQLNQVQLKENQIEDLKQQIETLNESIRQIEATMRVCPTCGQPILNGGQK